MNIITRLFPLPFLGMTRSADIIGPHDLRSLRKKQKENKVIFCFQLHYSDVMYSCLTQ